MTSTPAFPSGRALILGVLLALALSVPAALTSGFSADDYFQILLLEDAFFVDVSIDRFDVFAAFDGDPAHLRVAQDTGIVPWFAHPELKVRFWRPLSARLMWLDVTLFGRAALGYKVHSLLWYAALVLAAGALFRRLAPGRAATIGLLVFAVAYVHWQPVTWIASRYALVTATFTALALLAHVRRREDGWQPGAWLTPVCVALALLGGEAGSSALLYLVAYEALGRSDALRRRIGALAAPLLIAVVWVATYVALGYGTHASDAYVNPLQEPLAYLSVMPVRIFGMIAALFLGTESNSWFIPRELQLVFAGCGVVSLLIVVWLLRAVLAGDQRGRHGIWVGAGTALALFPQAAGATAPRSLAIPSLGAAFLIGLTIDWGWRRWRARRRQPLGLANRLRVAVVVLTVLVHLVWSPIMWFVWTALYHDFERTTRETVAAAEVLADPALAERKLVMLACPNPALATYYPLQRIFEGRPVPRAWLTLSLSPHDHRVHRTADDTLELEVLGGTLMTTPWETHLRGTRHPLEVGHETRLDGVAVRVLSCRDGRPTRIEVRFDRRLEDRSLIFTGPRLEPIVVPALGESVLVSATAP